MKPQNMKRKVISIAIAAAVGALSSGTVAAQDNTVEEVTVTGIRGSLQQAMDIKRQSSGVVDAISAEDIGKMPDANLAESLQRITGVSIDRSNNEGNQVTVRGFGPSFNLVTLNNRAMPSASSPRAEGAGDAQARSFNFAEIASESVSGVEVFKTARADKTTGGIGAIVNIKTAKPFDNNGETVMSATIKAVSDSSNVVGRDATPEVSGRYSQTFADNTFGVLIAASHAERDSRVSSVNTDGWLKQGPDCASGYKTFADSNGNGNRDAGEEVCNAGGSSAWTDVTAIDTDMNPDRYIWSPRNYNMSIQDHERTRDNAQIVLQWAPTDALTATLDYTLSRFKDEVVRHETAVWHGNYQNQITDERGTVIANWTGLGQVDFMGHVDDIKTDNDSLGLGLEWAATDSLTMNFDLHHSTSHAQPNGDFSEKSILLNSAASYNCCDAGQALAGTQFTTFYGQPAGSLPVWFGSHPSAVPEFATAFPWAGGFASAPGSTTPLNQQTYVLNDSTDFSNGTNNSTVFGFGADMTTVINPATGLPYPNDALNNGIDDGAYGAAGNGASIWNAQNVQGNLVISRGNEVLNTINQFQMGGVFENSSDADLKRIRFGAGYLDYQYDTTFRMINNPIAGYNAELTQNPTMQFISRGNTGSEFANNETLFNNFLNFDVRGMYTDLCADGFCTPQPDITNKINEATASLFTMFEFESDLAGRTLDTNLGLRYESTDIVGETIQDGYLGMNFNSITELRPQRDGSHISSTELKGDYSVFLPSLDLAYHVNDEVTARASFGRTLSRTDLTALRPAPAVSDARPNGPYLAYQGNPNLKPYLSDNLDLAIEWYYSEGSYVALNYFRKQVTNYIQNTTTNGSLYDYAGNPLRDPSAGDAAELAAEGCTTGNNTQAAGTSISTACMNNITTAPVIDWLITTPVNQNDATVDGWEFAIQHIFGESGFGTSINYTAVNGDVSYDPYNYNTPKVALVGLSDSANLIAFYEKDNFQVRLAYNWRDSFLLSTDQLRAPGEPVFVADYGQLDANIGYDISENVSIFVEALNLTEETSTSHGRFDNQFVSAASYGARYNLGIRANF